MYRIEILIVNLKLVLKPIQWGQPTFRLYVYEVKRNQNLNKTKVKRWKKFSSNISNFEFFYYGLLLPGHKYL